MVGGDHFMSYEAPLSKHAVAISISESPDLSVLGLGKEHLVDSMAEVARHLLAMGARLIYGGDLRPGGFTDILFELIARYRRDADLGDEHLGVTNVLAWPVHLTFDTQQLRDLSESLKGVADIVFLTLDGSVISHEDRYQMQKREATDAEWSDGLTAMRNFITRTANARVSLGGKVDGFKGLMPGIAEEALAALNVGQPLFLFGGFGGCARDIAEELALVPRTGYRDWPYREAFAKFDWENLNNGLNEQDNCTLASTVHVNQAMTLILRGLLRQGEALVTDQIVAKSGDKVNLLVPEFPPPIVQIAITANTREDHEKLGIALDRLAEHDRSFEVSTDYQTGETVIGGMNELQLEIIINRLKREFAVGAKVGKPKVVYRETITQPSPGKEVFKKQTGGRGQFAHVELEIEPAPGEGFVFENEIMGNAIPREFIEAVEQGVRNVIEHGFLVGYELTDIRVRLLVGGFHEVDSDAHSFTIAGSLAFENALKEAKPVLLEPIMGIEVVTPSDYTAQVMRDLNSRHASIERTEQRGKDIDIITALAPLREMFGYEAHLRSATNGGAAFTMQFEVFEQVPVEQMRELILTLGTVH
jgi:SLOG cluster2/Elongation factor G, domain IV/Elongation factor G C-terminus/Elongation Factor G, domain III